MSTARMNCRCTFAAGMLALLLLPTVVLAQTTRPATQPSTQPDAPRPKPIAPPDSTARPTLGDRVAEGHKQRRWDRQPPLHADIEVLFMGNRLVAGTMIYDHQHERVRMELDDGTIAVFDGSKAWVSPADAEFPRARFHLLTWPYFLAAPFKLDDPGTNLDERGVQQLDGRNYLTAKLTFDEGVGDAPDDWYLLYVDPVTSQLKAMAYIVTYGGVEPDQAEQEIHAITYENFGIVNGVVLSTKWRFWHWNEEQGIHGDPIGEVTLKNVRFAEAEEGTFDKPADAREDKLPSEKSSDG